MKVKTLEKLVEEYDEKIYEAREETEDEISTFWDHFFYGSYVEHPDDGSYEFYNRDPIELSDKSVATYVDHEEFLNEFGDKVLRAVVNIGGTLFACEGWYDSWNGDGAFEGPVYKVLPEEVVTRTWRKVE